VIADKRLREQKSAAAVADKLGAVTLAFTLRAGEDGKLFGSVTNLDVHRALEERGFTIERRRVLLEEPIKALGEHKVAIHVGPDTRATVTVTVAPVAE
jgi:large subunit ribosomal protein L9